MAIARRSWYQHVRYCIGVRHPKTKQERAIARATEKAMADLAEDRDADLKIRVIRMVLIRRSHNYYGASYQEHMHYRTAQNICIAFIEAVARYAGYM